MTPKDIAREGLGKDVRAGLSRRHMNELDRLKCHHITDPVVLDVDMLRPLIMQWVHGKQASRLIFDEHRLWFGALQVDGLEQLTDPHDIYAIQVDGLDSINAHKILRLHRRHSNDGQML